MKKVKTIIQNINKIEEKTGFIKLRITGEKKKNWKKICVERRITLTSLIIDSVENRILDDERREILAFIEKQDNLFLKIETNINQVAKIVNGQKMITGSELKDFSEKLLQLTSLKIRQNEMFEKIYALLAK